MLVIGGDFLGGNGDRQKIRSGSPSMFRAVRACVVLIVLMIAVIPSGALPQPSCSVWLRFSRAWCEEAEASRRELIRIGVTNRFLLAPAFGYLSGPDGRATVVLSDFPDSAQLRKAYERGEIDIIVDSQASLALLDPKTAEESRVFWDVAASGGDIVILSRGGTGSPTSVAQLPGRSVVVAPGSASHYFLIWLADLFKIQGGAIRVEFRDPVLAHRGFQDGRFTVAAVEEPAASALLASVPGSRVLISTASYQPVIHYLAVARRSFLQQRRANIQALIDAFYDGEEAATTWTELLKSVMSSQGITGNEAYRRLKVKFLDRSYNRESFFGTGHPGQGVMDAAIATWRQFGLAEAARKSSSPMLVLDPSLIQGSGPSGRPLSPTPRPWSGEHIEILRFESVIQFELDSAKITGEGYGLLDEIVQNIRRYCNDSYQIEVEGFTDNIGTPAHNLRLSQARAKVVADYLAKQLRLSPGDVRWKGKGMSGEGADKRRTVIRVIQKVVSVP